MSFCQRRRSSGRVWLDTIPTNLSRRQRAEPDMAIVLGQGYGPSTLSFGEVSFFPMELALLLD